MKKNEVAFKLADVILFALEKAADGYLALDHFSRSGTSVFYGYDIPKSKLRNTIHRLNKRGLIIKDEENLILKLSDAGRDWVFKHGEFDEEKWDGVWRLVIFDIPESHKKVRETLRRKLKEWGFVVWQKSVWATKKPVTEEIRKIAGQLKVEDWVMVIESSNAGRS